MAKPSLIPLIKPIEAMKVHPRTGIPLGLPDVTIPYGALIAYVGNDQDREKFTYLGELFACKKDAFLNGTGGHKPAPKLSAAVSPSAAAPAPALSEEKDEAPAVSEPRLEWKQLKSSDYAIRRAAVPGGWLVVLVGTGVTFVPDARHEWDGASPE